MNKLLQNKALLLSNFGVYLRRINSSQSNHVPITYAHQDDYYIFGLVENGEGCGIIDFKEQHFSSGMPF